MRRRVIVLLVAASLAAWPAALARADSAPIPAGSPAPGSDPAHATPLELLAGTIASHIAGRQVTVNCENQDDWNVLATQAGFAPSEILGVVLSPRVFTLSSTFVSSATTAYLSPATCLPLEQFAEAATKPTTCQPTTSTQTDVTRYQVVTRYRIVGRGRKRHRVAYKAKEPYTAVVTTTGLGPLAPCFAEGQRIANQPPDYWTAYEAYAEALLALAHEPVHLWQDQAGARVPDDSLVESQAECSGMQWLPYVAETLGATPDDAQAIADYFWTVDYPRMQALGQSDAYAAQHPYWSADCVPGGALDIRPPGATAWP